MDEECIFCLIAAKKIPSNTRYEDEEITGFDDRSPKAKIHILFVPKKHIANLNEATEEDREILGRLLLAVKKTAQKLGINQTGYRVIINTKEHAGMEMDHLHIHLLGGELLGPMVTN
ncbi:histidine triad nucleotide-binding protein [Candidatus Berkelbacteria bacterium]|nr:histidine triad nucleotide-binding protein [Candidatus Berkelbacteria bacterium]MBI2588452.1 histidine triad nucleotide-binding protein [Candidatus Berkelbacteria bacterium]MBI4029575.1 histidine triad nucleotide-binding protein [Candidatus Berkelbacteria bacterium]